MPRSAILGMLIACLTSFGLGFIAQRIIAPTHDTHEAAAATGLTMSDRLAANLYQQTAAEYDACCRTIYAAAERRLTEIVQNGQKVNRPAVILDLDETVIDNAVFQTYLLQNHLEYSDERWAVYEEQYGDEVTLIPGALAFLKHAEKLGVETIFISNRNVKYQASTVATLRRLGINPDPIEERLLLKTNTSDKTSRREEVMRRCEVVMVFGDNLRDFSEAFIASKVAADAPNADFQAAIAKRFAIVEQEKAHWGVDWFVLPNPVYGEWEKLVGRDPLARLRPTKMTMK